jgi:hypothetical protein
MLEAPRELLARARLALEAPPEAPLKALPPPRDELLCGMLRLPTRSPPPEERLALVLPEPPRFALVLLAPPVRDGAWRLDAEELLRAWDCRVDAEPPRVLPPYLLAVLALE